jgi:hypothetical protein
VKQNIFKMCPDISEQAAEVNFDISHFIVKSWKLITEGDFEET